jgi:hypothetical protein
MCLCARALCSSNSLPPPSQSRQSGVHRQLRGQSSASSQPQEPAWQFIGSTPSNRNVAVGSQASGATWRASVGNTVQHPMASSSASPQQPNLLGPARIGHHDPSMVCRLCYKIVLANVCVCILPLRCCLIGAIKTPSGRCILYIVY